MGIITEITVAFPKFGATISNTGERLLALLDTVTVPHLIPSAEANLCIEKSPALVTHMITFDPLQSIVFIVEQTECILVVCYEDNLERVRLGK